MGGYPQFPSWISIALAKICFSRIVRHKPHKKKILLEMNYDFFPLKCSCWCYGNICGVIEG